MTYHTKPLAKYGADKKTRTSKALLPLVPETSASTNSAISAYGAYIILTLTFLQQEKLNHFFSLPDADAFKSAITRRIARVGITHHAATPTYKAIEIIG